MRKDYKKLSCRFEPPRGLLEKILRGVRKEENRLAAARRRLAVFSLVLLAAGAALLPAFRMLQGNLAESGFIRFFSLIFSDSGAAFAYWRILLFALLESFPAISVIVFLGAIFVFLQSLKFIARDTKVVFSPLNNY